MSCELEHPNLCEPAIGVSAHQLRFGGIVAGEETARSTVQGAHQRLTFDSRAGYRRYVVELLGNRSAIAVVGMQPACCRNAPEFLNGLRPDEIRVGEDQQGI